MLRCPAWDNSKPRLVCSLPKKGAAAVLLLLACCCCVMGVGVAPCVIARVRARPGSAFDAAQLLRLRGGGGASGEVDEDVWTQRLSQWEGENNASGTMHAEESADGSSAGPGSAVPSHSASSSHESGQDVRRAAANVPAEITVTRGAHVDAIPQVAESAMQDRMLQSARRASVIQELLSMGADIRRAGLSVFPSVALSLCRNASIRVCLAASPVIARQR